MTQHRLSLIDVLIPPVNRWLIDLSRKRANLPAGVRVIRFSDDEDDTPDDVAAAMAEPPTRWRSRRRAASERVDRTTGGRKRNA